MVLPVGREDDATIAFVDLWRGILILCDLSQIKDEPWLRYVPLQHRDSTMLSTGNPRLPRDLAVVNGHFNDCGCVASELVASVKSLLSLEDDSWEPVCEMESSESEMDIESNPGFELLPDLDDDEGMRRTLPPFNGLRISLPTLSSDTDDHTVSFMAKVNFGDDEAWVIDVDTKNNRLKGVAEFDASRYTIIAYNHSRISKCLKRAR
ncbi:hypothetical protein BS78_03G049800 [Paspalum vaginatum]|nr:hypothetical protein BS78_03G049800 [Paspalum vaginatum]